MKRAFTIIEVSILFVIFLIVAFLVAPLSLDDTLQVKNASTWRHAQGEFNNLFHSINAQSENEDFNLTRTFEIIMQNEVKSDILPYKITYLNGSFPISQYRFSEFKQTNKNAVIAYKIYDEPKDGVYGILMYDVNGQVGPNTWGKDVFGLDIYKDHFEPFCKNKSVKEVQAKDCSKTGSGLCCSNYYLIGGSIK